MVLAMIVRVKYLAGRQIGSLRKIRYEHNLKSNIAELTCETGRPKSR